MNNVCTQCPRACGARPGYCGAPERFHIARAALHHWEEPVISGSRGSGTVFFSGCNLGCVFCQNHEISLGRKGKEVSSQRLAEIFQELADAGAHNLNLVTASHYTEQLLPLLDAAPLPVVWNSSAYESVETLRTLAGKVAVFLPDFKFALPDVAGAYANAPDYPETAKAAILEMFRQAGPAKVENGLLTRGVLLRHLILPGNVENSLAVIDWVAETFAPGDVLFSLMSQYTPYRTLPHPELNRRLTKAEFIKVRNYMLKRGVTHGFWQSLSSAKEEYTPDFDFTGV